MCLYAIYVVYLINKLARLKLLPGFICLLLCVFLIVVVVFVIATVFFIVLLLFLFFDYFFCLLFESFLAAVVVVAFKCFFFNRLFRFVAYSALFVSFTHRLSPSQSRKRRHFDYTLYFLTLAFRIIGGSAQSSAGGVSRRFSSDASPDLAATEARLLQSMRFYATALLLFFCSFVFVLFTTISQSSVSHGGIFRTIVDSSI